MEKKSEISPRLTAKAISLIRADHYEDASHATGFPCDLANIEVGEFRIVHHRPAEQVRHHEQILYLYHRAERVLTSRRASHDSDWQLASMKRGDWEIGFLLAA